MTQHDSCERDMIQPKLKPATPNDFQAFYPPVSQMFLSLSNLSISYRSYNETSCLMARKCKSSSHVQQTSA